MIPKKRKSTSVDESLDTSSTSLLNNSIPSSQMRTPHGPLTQTDSMSMLSRAMESNTPSDSEDEDEEILPSDEEILPVIQPYVPPQVDDLMSTMTIVPVVRRKSQDMAIVPGIQLHFWGFPENKAQRYGIEDMDRDVYSVVPVGNMDWNQEGSEFVSAMFQPFSTSGETPLNQPFEQKPDHSESQQFELTEGVFDETSRDQGGILILDPDLGEENKEDQPVVCSILDDEQVSDLADQMLASVREIMENEGNQIQEIFKTEGSLDESEVEGPRQSQDNEGKEDIYDAIFAGKTGVDPEQQFIKEANAFIDEQGQPKKPKKCGCKKIGKDGKPLNEPCICKKGKRSTSIIEVKSITEEEDITQGMQTPTVPQEADEIESIVAGDKTSEQEVPEEDEAIESGEPTEKEEETTDTGEAGIDLEEASPAEEEPTADEEELPHCEGEELEAEEPLEKGEEAVELDEPLEAENDTTEVEDVTEPEEPQEIEEEISETNEEAVQPEEGEEPIITDEPQEIEEEVGEESEDAGEEGIEQEELVEIEQEALPDTGEVEVEQEETPEEAVSVEPEEGEEGAEPEEGEEGAEPEEGEGAEPEEGEESAEPEEGEECVEPMEGEEEIEPEEGEECVEEVCVASEEPEEPAEVEISDNDEEAVEPEEAIEVEESEVSEPGQEAVESEEEPVGQEEEGEERGSEEDLKATEDEIEAEELPDTGEEEIELEQPSEEVEEGVESEEPEEPEEAAESEEPIVAEEEEAEETGEDVAESEELPNETEITDDGILDTAELEDNVPEIVGAPPLSRSRELIEELSRCACCCMKLLLAQSKPVTPEMPSPEDLPCLAAQIAKESNVVSGDETTVEEETPEGQLPEQSQPVPSVSDLGESEGTMEPPNIPDESGEEMVSDIENIPDAEDVPISEEISDITDESDAGEMPEENEMIAVPDEGYDTIVVEGPLEQEVLEAPAESYVDEVPVTETAEDTDEIGLEECTDEGPVVEEVPDSEEIGVDEVPDNALDLETPVTEEVQDSDEIVAEQASEELPDSGETELCDLPDSGEDEVLASEDITGTEEAELCEVPDVEESEAPTSEDAGEIEPEEAIDEAPATEEVPASEEAESDEVTDEAQEAETPASDAPTEAGEIEPEEVIDEAPATEEVPASGEAELDEVKDDVLEDETPASDEPTEAEEIEPEEAIDETLASEEVPDSGEAKSDEVTDVVIDSDALVTEAPTDSEEMQLEQDLNEVPTAEDTKEIIVCGDETEDDEIAPEISEPVITEEALDMEDLTPDQEIEGEEAIEVSKSEEEEAEQETSVAGESEAPIDGEEGSSAQEEVVESGEEEIPSEIEEISTKEDSKQGFDEPGEEMEDVMPGQSSSSAVVDKTAFDENEIIRRELSDLVTVVVSLEGGLDRKRQKGEEIPGAGDQLLTKLIAPPTTSKSIIGKELSSILDKLFCPPHSEKSIIGEELSILLDKLFRTGAPEERREIVPLTDEQAMEREIAILIDKAIAIVEGVPLEVLRPYEVVGPPKGAIIDITLVVKKRRHLQRKKIYQSFEFQEQKDVTEAAPEAPEGDTGDEPIAEETPPEEGEPAEPPKEEEGPTEAEVVPPEPVEEIPCPEPPQELPEETSNEKYRMKKFLAEFDIQMAPIKDRIRDLQKQVVDLGIPEFDRIIVMEPAFMRDPPAERPFEMPCKPCKKRPQPIRKNKPFPPCCTRETACPQAASTNGASVCCSNTPPKFQAVPCSCSRPPMLEQNPAPRNQSGTTRPTKCLCSSPKPGCGQK